MKRKRKPMTARNHKHKLRIIIVALTGPGVPMGKKGKKQS